MSNRDYYRTRAAQETALAEQSERSEVRRVHQELAKRYRAHADGEQPSLTLVR